jgi:hypothetical protein
MDGIQYPCNRYAAARPPVKHPPTTPITLTIDTVSHLQPPLKSGRARSKSPDLFLASIKFRHPSKHRFIQSTVNHCNCCNRQLVVTGFNLGWFLGSLIDSSMQPDLDGPGISYLRDTRIEPPAVIMCSGKRGLNCSLNFWIFSWQSKHFQSDTTTSTKKVWSSKTSARSMAICVYDP